MGKLLYMAGTVPFIVLGAIHIAYTIMDLSKPTKLVPHKPELMHQMRAGTLALTKETTMWKAWVGFNLSHGIGVLFFGAVYLYLSVVSFEGLRDMSLLFYLAPLLAILYLTLSRKYWFSIPAMGSTFGVVCFIAGAALA